MRDSLLFSFFLYICECVLPFFHLRSVKWCFLNFEISENIFHLNHQIKLQFSKQQKPALNHEPIKYLTTACTIPASSWNKLVKKNETKIQNVCWKNNRCCCQFIFVDEVGKVLSLLCSRARRRWWEGLTARRCPVKFGPCDRAFFFLILALQGLLESRSLAFSFCWLFSLKVS